MTVFWSLTEFSHQKKGRRHRGMMRAATKLEEGTAVVAHPNVVSLRMSWVIEVKWFDC